MDREQARFILQSFRPDGADSGDPDFEEALAVAAGDRELGDWLLREQEQDAFVSVALRNLAIPSTLRGSVLTALTAEGNGTEEEEGAEEDNTDAGQKLTEIESSPPGSRPVEALPAEAQELTVLKVEIAGPQVAAGDGPTARDAPARKPGWLHTALIATLLVLGAFWAFEVNSSNAGSREGKGERIGLRDLEAGAIAEVTRQGLFPLRSSNLQAHQAWLRENNAPGFDPGELSPGVLEGRPVGCRFFMVGTTRISHVCFDMKGSRAHLVVVRSEDLKAEELGKFGERGQDHCRRCRDTGVSMASWQGKDQAYLLLAKLREKELLELLRPPAGE